MPGNAGRFAWKRRPWNTFQDRVVLVATSDGAGNPHMAATRGLSVAGEDRVIFEKWFCMQTIRNHAQNPKISLALLELAGWKAKIYHVVRKLDKVSTGDKQKVVPMVNELHMVTEELSDRIERLQRECPVQWEPDKIELEGKVAQLKTRWEEVWQNVSPADIGG